MLIWAALQQTIGIHVRGSGNGVASERINPMLSETRLQWSSDSTIGVSPTVAVENGRRRQQQQQQQQYQHHHHHLHHYYHLSASKQEKAAAAAAAATTSTTTSASSSNAKTNGVLSTPESDGCSGCAGGVEGEEEDQHSDSEVDVCAYCSEWLSKALLCSCQVQSVARI